MFPFDHDLIKLYDEGIELKKRVEYGNLTRKTGTHGALELYAQQRGKNTAEVLDDALAKFLDFETWFTQAVEEGIAAADRGELIAHCDVRNLIESRYPG